jgi:hypothetical protein
MSDTQKDKKDSVMKKTDVNLPSSFNTFLRNEHHTFSVLKSEKLASAVYLISGFVSENDPLRTRLRTCAIDLVSCVTDLKGVKNQNNHTVFGSRCLEMGSLLTLAERAGLVSSMNARILCDEYAALGSFVRQHEDRIFASMGVDLSVQAPVGIKSQQSLPRTNSVLSKNIGQGAFKRTKNDKRHQDRRGSILSLLDKKDKITVKDAGLAMVGVSEKTIQRELIAMVEEGVLLREGERRWSTYKKAS